MPTLPFAAPIRAIAAFAAWLSLSAQAEGSCPPSIEVGPGVHLIERSGEPPTPVNRGMTANSVFIVAASGVIVADPGPTREAAAALRCAVRRETALPIVAVIDTHPHPENVLANHAFPGVPIYASAEAVAAMQSRCRECARRLLEQIGRPTGAETVAFALPDHPVAGARTVEIAGRQVDLLPLGAAHSPGDLAILDRQSGVLLAGGVATVDRLPDLHDGSASRLLAALRTLQALPQLRRVVPAQGAAFAPERLAEPVAYLETLLAIARRRIESPEGFVPPATLPTELSAFPGDPIRHMLNLQHALREAEAQWWEAGKP